MFANSLLELKGCPKTTGLGGRFRYRYSCRCNPCKGWNLHCGPVFHPLIGALHRPFSDDSVEPQATYQRVSFHVEPQANGANAQGLELVHDLKYTERMNAPDRINKHEHKHSKTSVPNLHDEPSRRWQTGRPLLIHEWGTHLDCLQASNSPRRPRRLESPVKSHSSFGLAAQ